MTGRSTTLDNNSPARPEQADDLIAAAAKTVQMGLSEVAGRGGTSRLFLRGAIEGFSTSAAIALSGLVGVIARRTIHLLPSPLERFNASTPDRVNQASARWFDGERFIIV